jgi:hypothetical protein
LRRIEVYVDLNGLVERRRVEPLQIVEQDRERVFRPRRVVDEELAITDCRSSLASQVLAVKFWESRINDPFTTSAEIFTARRRNQQRVYANPALVDDNIRGHDLRKRAAAVKEAQGILLDGAVCRRLR